MLKKILFVCTHNSARSQMAEALTNHYYGNILKAYSAGTHPSVVNPFAIKVLNELGIDTANLYSKSLDEFKDAELDFVITVCDSAKEECPWFVAKTKATYVHKSFKDPSLVLGSEIDKLRAFRDTRDEIKDYLDKLMESGV